MASLSVPKKAFFVGLIFVPFLGSVGADRLAPVVPAVLAEVVLEDVDFVAAAQMSFVIDADVVVPTTVLALAL